MEQSQHPGTCHLLITMLCVQVPSPVEEGLSSIHAVTATLRGLDPEIGPRKILCFSAYPSPAVASARLYVVF